MRGLTGGAGMARRARSVAGGAWLGWWAIRMLAGDGDPWIRHRLIEGSTFLDDCPPCARPTVPLRLRGTHDVRGETVAPGVRRVALRDIRWQATGWAGEDWHVTGIGCATIRDDGSQCWELDAVLSSGSRQLARHFVHTTNGLMRLLPNLAADLESEERTPSRVFRVVLRSAPVRDLWFVTAHGFTPSHRGVPTGERRAAGDILSMDGHLVAKGERLVSRMGIMPVVPPLALGSLDVLGGGRILFSLREPVFSETLGMLGPGMLLASDGAVFRDLAGLLEGFGTASWTGPDPGIDAVQVLASGEVLFSATSDIEWREGRLGHGDVLSSAGRVHRRLKALIAAFDPTAWPGTVLEETGLDAWHEWPWGEAWFSVRQGFQSRKAGPVQAGDLLSDRGWIVCRNLELLEGFQPLEDLADFGLEGLFGVTDIAVEPPRTAATWRQGPNGLVLGATGEGRAWQLESASSLGGPFRRVSPPTPWPAWEVPMRDASGWYRVRAW